jgi:uncharacterized protein YdeI (YjbR/CyaY-like superfamily)
MAQTKPLDKAETFYARNVGEWRAWLKQYCEAKQSVWLIMHHKQSRTPSVDYEGAIEQALCYGWIDSKARKRDPESSYLFFSKRNPKSAWSLVNQERVKKMMEHGLMTSHGQALIDLAKQTGTWDALADAQHLVVPGDLQKLFGKNDVALKNFQAFPPSSKRAFLEWIATAKKTETRQRRIERTVQLAADNIRAIS